ncbi:PQQ-binding-like beta-propeller repeat protein [Aestuariivivens sediminis]|uniref:outer membrane protein assembly factor BamB family protein n=1 Tax=Aestuariivivens sediminis TaxID=2913557 RepID=UPI001F56723D|nr:PQQ-binding-like beta-propeller repeat protein [Aestuariivivens sediminis]
MKQINKLLKYGIFLFLFGIVSCENEDSVLDTKPVAAFSVNETEVIEGNASVFTDLSFDQNGSISSWSWNFGDGTTSSEQSPVHTYEKGAFTVVLTVTDNSGNINVNEFSKTINVVEPSTATTEPTKVWVFNLPAKFESASPAVGDDGTVYMACSAKNGLDNMFAINSGGSLKWSYAAGDINRSTVSIDDNGNVYFGSYDDNLYAFSPDGTLRFQFDTGSNPRYNGAVFASDGTIYIGSQSDALFALNPDGTEKWNFGAGGDFNATPAIASDGTLFVGNTDDFFYAINPDGTEKWKSEYGSWTACATAIGEDGTVYFSGEGNNLDPTSGGVLIAYDPNDGTEKWRVGRTNKVSRGGPVIAPDGTLYLAGQDGKLLAYNSADGTIKWSYDLLGESLVTPAIDNDGNIYVGDESGFFHVIDPDGNKKWKEMQLGSRVWSSAAIGSDGTIYVAADQSDGTGKLFALKTNASGPASSGWPMRSKNAKHQGR